MLHMKKEQSLVRLTCPSTVTANKPFTIVVEFDFVHSASIASLIGHFEGIVRTAFSNQQELRSLSAIRLDFDPLLRQWRSAAGKLRAPAGHYTHESRVAVRSGSPGTFFAKNGAIEYAVTVRLRINGRFGQSEVLQVRPVIVIPIVDVSQCLPYRAPIRICKTFRRKIFCFNKTNTTVTIELQKAAFVQGERILVRGEIANEHSSNSIKGGLVELVMLIRCRCKGNEKNSATTVAHFAIAAVPLQSINTFEHTLQVPMDAFPTFSQDDVLVQCSYHLSVSVHECPPIVIPLIIGTGKPTTPINPTYPALTYSELYSHKVNKSIHPPTSHLSPFFPPPPPPYAFALCGALPSAPMYGPPYVPYGNTPPPQFRSKSTCHGMDTKYEGQSVLRIEEID